MLFVSVTRKVHTCIALAIPKYGFGQGLFFGCPYRFYNRIITIFVKDSYFRKLAFLTLHKTLVALCVRLGVVYQVMR